METEYQKREFTGVWIPKVIVEDEELTVFEKWIFAEISCFDEFFMKKETLAKRYSVSEKTIQRSIATLLSKGYVIEKSNNGRNRILKACPVRVDKFVQSGWTDMSSHTILDNNIENKELAKTEVFAGVGFDVAGTAENAVKFVEVEPEDSNDQLIKKTRRKPSNFNDQPQEHPAVNKVLGLFSEINTSYRDFFGNKTQRKAVDSLLKTHKVHFEDIEQTLAIASNYNIDPKTFKAWAVYTPLDLKKNWDRIRDYAKSHIIKTQTEKPKVYYTKGK